MRVLVTGIGGDIAQAVATILRERRDVGFLLGVDLHGEHGGQLFVDQTELVPSARHPGYLEAIRGIAERFAIDVIFPMTEPELAVWSEEGTVKWGRKIISAGPRVIAAGVDKLATSRELQRIGIPGPWTFQVGEQFPREYPCILKDRFGSGSRAVFVVGDRADAEYLSSKHPNAVYQQLLEPPDKEVTCAVYRTLDGRVATLQMLRRLSGGFTGWAKVVRDDATEAMCEALAVGLDLRGSMNVQLRLTAAGPRIFEINPRFSSTTLMRHRAGFSDVCWALDESLGRSVALPEIRPGKILLRVQGAAVVA